MKNTLVTAAALAVMLLSTPGHAASTETHDSWGMNCIAADRRIFFEVVMTASTGTLNVFNPHGEVVASLPVLSNVPDGNGFAIRARGVTGDDVVAVFGAAGGTVGAHLLRPGLSGKQ